MAVIVPTINPTMLLKNRDDDAGLGKYEQTVIIDLKKAARLTRERPRWDERVIWERDSVGRLKNLFPTPEEVIDFCARVRGQDVSTDTETTGEQMLNAELMCAGFAAQDKSAICVPFMRRGGSRYWAPHDEWRVKGALAALLADQTTKKIIHNRVFDEIVYWVNGMPVLGPVSCCYVDSETEFLTETGWKKYDQIADGEKLATVSKQGTLDYQKPFKRISKEYSGDVYTIETQHSRAVVTANHRMLIRPFYRQRAQSKVGAWEFRRAENIASEKPDMFDVRVAFERFSASEVCGTSVQQDGQLIDRDFAVWLGLWITDGTLGWRNAAPYSACWTQDVRGQAINELRRLVVVMNKRGFNVRETSCTSKVQRKAGATTATEIFFWVHGGVLARTFHDWCGRYSRKRRLPKFALSLPVVLREALLKGLMLGDSGIVHGRHIYRTTCKGLAGDVQALALSLGYAASIHWAGDCYGVTIWQRKTDRAGAWLKRGQGSTNISKRKRTTRVVCFSVPNETLVTRSRGKPAFHGNTMQQHHVIDSELPNALGFCGTRYLDARYWKDDVKGDEGWLFLDDVTLRSYNLRDCITTRDLEPLFMAEIRHLGLEALYQQELKLASLMGRATVRGLAVDFWRRDCPTASLPLKDKKGAITGYQKGLGPRLQDQIDLALAQLRFLAGRDSFDPMKPAQLADFLFSRLHLPIVKMSKSGSKPSTDKEALVLLALACDTPEQKAGIRALASFKSARQIKTMFVDGLKTTSDGRFHPSWRLLTTSGRFASSPNAQNFGRAVKSIFCAGNPRFGPDDTSEEEFAGVDLSQAEMRGIAYDANDARLLSMYAQKLNVHTVNLAMALKVRPVDGHKDLDPQTAAYIAQMMPVQLGPNWTYDKLMTADGNPLKGMRTLIKNDGFGRNYGAEEDIVFSTLRSKRDPDTNELLFPGLRRSEVEANGVMWRKMNVAIVAWWARLQAQVKQRGYYQCPISGRIRWFRAGFKKNDILGTPIQMMIASFMNERMLEIQEVFDRETGGQALIVQQVHDALNSAVPKAYSKRAAEVKTEILNRPVRLPNHPNAVFPPDDVLFGSHLSDV